MNLIASSVKAQCYIYFPIIYKSLSFVQAVDYSRISKDAPGGNVGKAKSTNTCKLQETITEGPEFNTITVLIDTQASTDQINTITFEWRAMNSLFSSPVVLEVLNFQSSGPILQKIEFNGTTYSANMPSPAMMTLIPNIYTGELEFILYFDSGVQPGNVSIYVDCHIINYVPPTPFNCGVIIPATPPPSGTPTPTLKRPTPTPTRTPSPTVTTTPDYNNSFGPRGNTLPITNGGVTFAPFPIPTRDPNATPVIDIQLTSKFNTPQGKFTGLEYAGNWFLTLLAYLDTFGFLPWIVMLLIAMLVIAWLVRFVTGNPAPGRALDISTAVDVGEATGTITGGGTAKKTIKFFNKGRR